MEDEEIRTAVRTMAKRRPVRTDTRDRILQRIAAKRQRRRIGLGIGAVAVVGAVALGASVSPAGQRFLGPTAPGQADSAQLTATPGPWGFSVEMTVSFPDDRSLLSGVFQLDGRQYPVSFYPNDGTDNEVQPDPLPLAAGVTVSSSAKLAPHCPPQSAQPPVLVLTSRLGDGTVREDRFSTANPRRYAAAVQGWCSRGAQVTLSRASGGRSGDVRVVLRIVNPGPKRVTVTSGAYNVAGAHWSPAAVTVPPGRVGTLVINAAHSSCGALETPWKAGLLKSNGIPVRLFDGDQWC